jgi:hypothetical protein
MRNDYTLGDTCLLARSNTVTVGVINSIRTSLVQGKEVFNLSVKYIDLKGEEVEVFVVPDQICVIENYNDSSQIGFLKEVAGATWANMRATSLKTVPPEQNPL